MPLLGLIDPSHAERRNDEPGRYPNWYTVSQLLHKAETTSPKWSPWTREMIVGALSEHQERDYISTTMLVGGCPRSSVLERREDWIGSLDAMYASLRGTMLHAMLERSAGPGSCAEARFFTTIDDIELSCSPDLIRGDTMYDYKMTENPPTFDYPYKKHTMQLQYNRFIVNNAERWLYDGKPFDIAFNPRELTFEHLVVVYLGPKGPKPIEVMKSKEVRTPNNKWIKRKLPHIMSDEEVLADISVRLHNMQRALDSYPVWPQGLEDEPGWEGPAGWGCPGAPICYLPNCLGKRYPQGLTWPREMELAA